MPTACMSDFFIFPNAPLNPPRHLTNLIFKVCKLLETTAHARLPQKTKTLAQGNSSCAASSSRLCRPHTNPLLFKVSF